MPRSPARDRDTSTRRRGDPRRVEVARAALELAPGRRRAARRQPSGAHIGRRDVDHRRVAGLEHAQSAPGVRHDLTTERHARAAIARHDGRRSRVVPDAVHVGGTGGPCRSDDIAFGYEEAHPRWAGRHRHRRVRRRRADRRRVRRRRRNRPDGRRGDRRLRLSCHAGARRQPHAPLDAVRRHVELRGLQHGHRLGRRRRNDRHRRLHHPVRRRVLEGRARGVAGPRRRRRPHRLRLPHGDHRRPARGRRRDGGLRRRGHHELQGLHGLQGRADGRRRAVHHRARADRQDRRARDGPLRERRRRRPLPEGSDGGGQRRPEVARVVAAAGGRGRGHGPRDQARRVDEAAAVRRARDVRAGGQGDPGGARPRPADLRRDLHPVPVPDRRRPRPAGLRGREVRVLAAAARGVQPGGPLPGAAPGRAAGRLDRPLPVQLRGPEGTRARRLHEDPERPAGDRAPADAALRPVRAAGAHDGERPRPPRLVGSGADLRARQQGRDRARLRRRHRRLRSRGQAHDLGRDAPDGRRLRPVRGLGCHAASRGSCSRAATTVYEDGKIVSEPGHGRFVKRSVFEPALPNREPVAV